MMTPKEVLNHVTAEPFRPFRIHTASGRSFEIKHPEVVQVGKTVLTLAVPLTDDIPDAQGLWYKLSLMLIESIEPLDTPLRRRDDPT
jgi:hypothetical protein